MRNPAEIIVVDNASTDGTVDMLEQHFPEVRVIRSQENLGFAKANNVGIRTSRGRYLALINPDVKLLSGCLERALAAIEAEPSIGVLGPAMIGRDGAIHRSGMRFPTLWNCVCDALMLHRLFGRRPIFGGQSMADFDWSSPRDVEVLNGWFWLIRRNALSEVGLLDEQFFMYGEDMDWCKRFYDGGWRIVFAPDAAAIHYGGGSAEQAPTRFYLEMQKANLQVLDQASSSRYAAALRLGLGPSPFCALDWLQVPTGDEDGRRRGKDQGSAIRGMFEATVHGKPSMRPVRSDD